MVCRRTNSKETLFRLWIYAGRYTALAPSPTPTHSECDHERRSTRTTNSGHYLEAAQRCLEAKERHLTGSEGWAQATARAICMLAQEECAEAAKPEWWNDEELKALSARVVRAAPNMVAANQMRAVVLSGRVAWKAGPRSAAELKKAAVHFDRAATLCNAPVLRSQLVGDADWCRSQASAML